MHFSKGEFDAQLKLAAVLGCGLIADAEIGERADHFSGCWACRYRDVVESDDAVCIEEILELGGYSKAVSFTEFEKARIAQIDIELRRCSSRIPCDADRPVGC